MTARREVEAETGQTIVIFELPGEVHEGPLSVVGSFNQWTPGVHVLELREDGQRSVVVVMDSDEDIHFRYLGSGGVWFDDPQAEITEYGSLLRLSEPASSALAEPDGAPAAPPKRSTSRSHAHGK